jgi:Flp pilus assembly protein TadG
MQKFLRNRDGASTVESALVALPVLLFIFGIIQTAYVLWIDNLLHYSVDYAARCGAIGSSTYPCTYTGPGNTLQDMQTTASTLFNAGSATFRSNNCSASGFTGTGLIGTYQVSILSVSNLNLTANSCYPCPNNSCP